MFKGFIFLLTDRVEQTSFVIKEILPICVGQTMYEFRDGYLLMSS
jgi:hypothetical protein